MRTLGLGAFAFDISRRRDAARVIAGELPRRLGKLLQLVMLFEGGRLELEVRFSGLGFQLENWGGPGRHVKSRVLVISTQSEAQTRRNWSRSPVYHIEKNRLLVRRT